MPPSVDWYVWRLVVDERIGVRSPLEVEALFTFTTGMQAHAVLDALDAAAAEAARRS